MSLININKRFVTLFITCLFLFSTFLSVNVSAEWETNDDEGIWTDEFDNDNDITLVDCVLNNGEIILEEGMPEYSYDYNIKPKNVAAWYHNSWIPKRLIGQILSLYINPNKAPGTQVENDMYKISLLDSITLNTTSGVLNPYDPNSRVYPPIHHFKFKIDQDLENIEKVTINWWFGKFVPYNNLKSITMYVWSYGDAIEKWDNPQKIIYSSENISRLNPNNPNNPPYPDITFPTFGGDEYISQEGYIDILIIGEPKENGVESNLFTDYVNVSVTTDFGYKPSGYIQSNVIVPPYFGGWESVFWNSLKVNETTSITIKILNQNGIEIQGYSSTSSPLDISDIEENKIILKVELQSNDLESTPRLKSWGFSWQNIKGYLDTFSNNYRIEESIGLNIDNEIGEISVSDFYSDWEIFGKNPANTRAYSGEGIGEIKETDDYYWYTDISTGGGGFQTPVYSDGKVYVPSYNNSILIYNATRDLLKRQDPWKISDPIYDVDTSIGVYNDYLIVATGSKGQNNKVYCLYKSDFTKKWEYSGTSGDKICFYAPPVIDDGIVYLTSWSGVFWDTPTLPFLNRFVNGKNKLIALDIESGTPIWQPVTLPEGSFSPPGIGEGKIYVGCQNMNGKSIFAFDIDTGNQIWNNSIGIIGRSGIVYGNGIVYAISNQRSSLFNKGINKIMALNAYDGKEIWNKTIASFDSIRLYNMVKGLSFFSTMAEAYAPITTPAYSDGTLYVLDPNGTFFALNAENGSEKWNYSLVGLLDIFTQYHTSPVIVGDTVYVVSGSGKIYAFKTEYLYDVVEPIWTYQITSPVQAVIDYYRPNILASPIVADSLLFVSSTDYKRDFTGRLFCIGDYSPNTKGFVRSKTIHVPTGHWWESIIADKVNSTSNTITISILNEKGELIKTIDPYKSNFNDISGLKTNAIKLHASFEINNDTQTLPILNSWAVNWTEENAAPDFREDSFKPGQDGWINQAIKQCSIIAYDNVDEESGVKSGIDVDSGRFKITYKETQNGAVKTSDWITTESDESSGASEARITADISAQELKIYILVDIIFTIKDLAGNQATSSTYTFKLDVEKPTSDINNREGFKDKYRDPVPITASASDPGLVNVSGIDFVSLLYKYRNSMDEAWSDDWEVYETLELGNYSWLFGDVSIDSGYYKIITQAYDKATNIEDIDDTKSIQFLYDNINPKIDTDFENQYISDHIPTFTISVSDDFLLESLEYRIGSETTWHIIANADDIDGKTYTTDWTVPEEIWTLWEEDKEYFIFFRVTDLAGNNFTSTTDNTPNIIKNQTIPDLYIDLSDFKSLKWDDEYTITANIPSYMQIKKVTLFYGFSKDNDTIKHYEQYGENLTTSPYKWSFKASKGNGHYSFYIRVEQTDGKVTTTRPETITLTILPLTFLIVFIILALLFVLITLTVLRKIV